MPESIRIAIILRRLYTPARLDVLALSFDTLCEALDRMLKLDAEINAWEATTHALD